jgi:DNA mismatch repair protein MutS
MRQYRAFKQQHPQCVLFFRMGDFYEMFYEDAVLAHKTLGVTLTQRTAGVPMAGVPFHAVEGYLRRMIAAGHRVAVCEQMEDPATAKGVVRREVTRLITPGTLTDETMLEEGSENPLAAIVFLDNDRAALAWAELSTGAFSVTTLRTSELPDELARIRPRELLYPQNDSEHDTPAFITNLLAPISCAPAARPAWHFRQAEAVENLRKQFSVTTLAGFGFSDDDPTLGPASAIVHYLNETQRPTPGTPAPGNSSAPGIPSGASSASASRPLSHLRPPRRFDRADHMVIDQTSLRSLEVERTLRSGEVAGSLLAILQDCRTAMGKRALRQTLCYPLRKLAAIHERQRAISALVEDSTFLDALRTALDQVQDVQRMAARIAVGRATPRDLVALGASVTQAAKLRELLDARPALAPWIGSLDEVAPALSELSQRIAQACVENPPGHLREGGLFRDGIDAQLDECRGLQRDSNAWIVSYQQQLIAETGIASLKVGFNKVFGFYIELTALNKDKAPIAWSRKQTLKSAERFTTPPLKEYEGKVLSADQRAVAREQELFAQLCEQAGALTVAIQSFAQTAAELDVLACLAKRAVRYRWTCPTVVQDAVLKIDAGRHPVLEELLGDRFVANDVSLSAVGAKNDATASDTAAPSLALITGPNMAGKSTFIRQAALLTLLAHTGSFVPADRAVIGLCDRIFTRIGASDELHTGQSTFMVEMTETANICHHATPASLVILDEIGRGTSTLDGLSLAWAIAEHLSRRGCRTLFATHYHELTQLPETHPNVANLNVTVREWQEQIVFLHRIGPGKADRSYGIHVAKIAGLPTGVVNRANELLSQLEVSHNQPHVSGDIAAGKAIAPVKAKQQLSLFTEYLDHPALSKLRELNLDAMTPMQAFDALRSLRESAGS